LGYPGSAPPLPNLPADPLPARRRTLPPPLPPTYPRGWLAGANWRASARV